MTPTDQIIQQILDHIHWQEGLSESLRDRQLWAAVASVLAILIYNFTGIHVRPDAVLAVILALVGLIVGAGVGESGHARAAGAATQALARAVVDHQMAQTMASTMQGVFGPPSTGRPAPVVPIRPPADNGPPPDPDPGAPVPGQ
jgi:hypothetical protein